VSANIGTELAFGNLAADELLGAEMMLRRLANRHGCPGPQDCRDVLGHADDVMDLRLAMEACGLVPYDHMIPLSSSVRCRQFKKKAAT
jgi:hypothetical protein